MKWRIGDHVWKEGGENGYSGPGKIVIEFHNWMGQPRFVVEHKIENGRGFFYHIYSGKELQPDLGLHPGVIAPVEKS